MEVHLPHGLEKRAPEGMRLFTLYRAGDESGVSGTGVVLEGVIFSAGACIIHWLTPPPMGSFNIFMSFDQFLDISVRSHPTNGSVITFGDGETIHYKMDGTISKTMTSDDAISPKQIKVDETIEEEIAASIENEKQHKSDEAMVGRMISRLLEELEKSGQLEKPKTRKKKPKGKS